LLQYKTGEQEMASTMALSIIASIITMGGYFLNLLITAITPREYGENMASITLSAAELLLHRLQALDVAYFYQLGHRLSSSH
jgi:hypothetical protein